MIFTAKLMETISETTSFYKFHDFWNSVLDSQSPQATAGQLLPFFPRISDEVFGITKIVEKLGLANTFHDLGPGKRGQANFFHHFHDSKDCLRNSWKTWKKLAWRKSWPGQVFQARSVEKC